MNCKQGDLAVIVRSLNGNEGKIVRCLRLHSSQTHDVGGVLIVKEAQAGPRWVIDPPVKTSLVDSYSGQFVRHDYSHSAPDAWLRPIRDNEGEDETLTWAGKPQEVTV